MGFNILVNSKILEKNFINDRKVFLFLSYFDMGTQEMFNLRLFIKNYKMVFYRLKTKQFNRMIQSCSKNNVVFKINNKNCELTCLNLSVLIIDNVLDFFFVVNYFLKNSEKLNLIYIKILNVFITYNYLDFLFQYFFKSNFLRMEQDKQLIIYNSFKLVFYIKLIFYKIYFFLKILIYFINQLKFYLKLIR